MILQGTAGRGLPVPGCRCRTCLAPPAALAPTSAYFEGVETDGTADGTLTLDLDSRMTVVSGLDGPAVLWAPRGVPVDEMRLIPAGLGVAALGVGDAGPLRPAHEIARLRASGAVDDRTRVLLVDRGHGELSADQSRARDLLRSAAWGLQSVADGTVVDLSRVDRTVALIPRRTLVLGPSGSGKSLVAEELLAAEPDVTYLATGPVPGRDGPDTAWAARVAAHRTRRPPWWRTVEGDDVGAVLSTSAAPVLLDAVGTWLSGALDRSGAWDDAGGWRERLATDVTGLVEAWRQAPVPVVAVAEEVGAGIVPVTSAGRIFRDELGRINARLAQESERVLLVVAGQVIALDGRIIVPEGQVIMPEGRT